jgi:hypothetical protein
MGLEGVLAARTFGRGLIVARSWEARARMQIGIGPRNLDDLGHATIEKCQ